MKKFFILLIILGASYQGYNSYVHTVSKPAPLYEQAYIMVYGRNSCGFTKQTMRDLKQAGIPFEYQIVDDKQVADTLHSRMEQSGIDTRRYNLPVVDVNNNIMIRPKSDSIIKQYKEF